MPLPLCRRTTRAIALATCCVLAAGPARAQVPGADSLARWIRSGYSLVVDSGVLQPSPLVREVWGELGWSGVGYGFRTQAARHPSALPSMEAFGSAMDYYRITLDELHTGVVGDIGLAWGVHTEEFRVRGQPPETVRVRFTNTLRWDGARWRNLLYHRDAQVFDAAGRYIRAPR